MHIIKIKDAGRDYKYKWPEITETFDFIEYITKAEDGEHHVKIGFGRRLTYGRDRFRVVIWIDGNPDAEFVGADDFEKSGEVLSEIKVPGNVGERICRYPDEPIPERYTMFNVEGLPNRIKGYGVHGAWAVIANIGDHKTLISLAALRRIERRR
jgi:hypothetical protein